MTVSSLVICEAKKEEMAYVSSLLRVPCALLLLFLQGISAATTHTVGGSTGWTFILRNSTFYDTWASSQTFIAGDSLYFSFTTGQQDIVPVRESGYTDCSTAANISKLITSGPATIPLLKDGTFYYICGMPAHCALGQKLAVTVKPGSASAAGGPGIAPSPNAAAVLSGIGMQMSVTTMGLVALLLA